VDAHRTVEAVWRIEAGRVIAGLARLVRDVGLAEELAQDALVAALEQWPREGVPENPGGWLMATAKHKAIDVVRRQARLASKLPALAVAEAVEEVSDVDDFVGDDLLRLLFTACHPVLPAESRVALTLRCLTGLTTEEIARGFLVPQSTAAQRIVRAKRTLTDKKIEFELPTPAEAEAEQRLASVLETIFLLFNEGYAASAGADWTRPALCEEALRLGRILAGLMPAQPEVHGLVALMEIQASRLAARLGPDGSPVLLADQDRRRWDRLLIRRGLAALARAESLSGERATGRGAYTMQAAIAACHARAVTFADTDWVRIVALYRELVRRWPSPVARLNLAVAVGMADGPAAGLALADQLADEPALAGYPLLPAVRGELLAKLGRSAEAREQFARAAEQTRNEREREIFRNRALE